MDKKITEELIRIADLLDRLKVLTMDSSARSAIELSNLAERLERAVELIEEQARQGSL